MATKEQVMLYAATQCKGKNNDKRSTLDLLHVRENDCFTTNGHNLFMVKDNLGLKPGAYQINKRTKTKVELVITDKESPEVSRVIPRDKDDWPVIGEFKITDHPAGVNAVITRAMEKNCIDQNLIPSFTSANSHYVVKVKDDFKPVIFENKTELALVMPFRM